jgi:hypothetical protein
MEYTWMTRTEIEKYIPEMERLDVSTVARSRRGFLYNYLKHGRSVKNKLVGSRPESNAEQTWGERRHNFIKRHLAQYNENPTYRRYLALIAWAYIPRLKPRMD